MHCKQLKLSFIYAKQKLPNREILEVQKGVFWKAAWLMQVPTPDRSLWSVASEVQEQQDRETE